MSGQERAQTLWWLSRDPITIQPFRPARSADPVLVIDGHSAQIEELCKAFVEAGVWRVIPSDVGDTHMHRRNQVADAIRALLDPKPYRFSGAPIAPWPEVEECQAENVDGHECPQCSWVHEHDWWEWRHPMARTPQAGPLPVRCSKCGGRKCDRDDCAQRRHTHTHADQEDRA